MVADADPFRNDPLIVVDAQLHEPAVTLEWEDADEATRRLVLIELQLGYMRAVGVERAVLFPIDLRWAQEAYALFPERFGIVPMIVPGGSAERGMIDALLPEAADLVAEQAASPAIVGMRVLPTAPTLDGGHRTVPLDVLAPAIAACEREGLPLFVYSLDHAVTGQIAADYPELTVIADHLGLAQPPTAAREEPPFRSLPGLLALARFPNVAVKVSAVPTLSTEPYPFADLWPHLHRVIDAFGPDRLMWGSDISRVYGRGGFWWRVPGGEGEYAGRHTYAESLFYLRETTELSAATKEKILGETALSLLRWP
jgi:L-fuconolactonase